MLRFISVCKYYLNTQILTLVYKYLRVFKYIGLIAHNNHPVLICIVVNYCVHIRYI